MLPVGDWNLRMSGRPELQAILRVNLRSVLLMQGCLIGWGWGPERLTGVQLINSVIHFDLVLILFKIRI